MHSSVAILVFLGCFVAVLAQFPTISILCYWCNPDFRPADCINPRQDLGQTNCSLQLAGENISDWTISCFSSFRIDNNTDGLLNLTGIYRGCTSHRRVEPFCERNVSGMTQVSCASCETDLCNTHYFDDAGNIVGSDDSDECDNKGCDNNGDERVTDAGASIRTLDICLMILIIPKYILIVF